MDVEVINLDDDSDNDSTTSSLTIGRGELSSPASSPSPSSTFGQDDFMTDEDFEAYVSGISGAVLSSPTPARPRALAYTVQSPTRTPISEINYQGRTYKLGKFVELHDGTFLRLNRIFHSSEGTVILGPKFERLETMDSLMPDRVNELCWVVDLGDVNSTGQPHSEEVKVPLSMVRRPRIIRITNHPYTRTSAVQNRDDGLLFCRIKYTRKWVRISTTSSRGAARIVEEAITYLAPEECQTSFSVSKPFLRENWRGRPPAGSGRQPRRYTFGDGFCGAGGVSRGAQQAGLKLVWAFDKSLSAMNSYRANFPSSLAETSDVADFLTNDSSDIRVDILHVSPPCQPFSSAKTIAAAHDDANEACLFSIWRLIEKCRPRIVTMEETSGLKERHKEWLYAIIHTFVELGYSVRWGIVNCKDYGVPQSRRRLVILAAGPGESLPPFPQPTHGTTPGLLPLHTILDAIGAIPSTAPDHDLERAERPFHRPPYDPRQLAKTLTCSGGDNYHPSGTRTFTLREAASLQTFPIQHVFCGPGVMQQIGNAVPPVLARALFGEVVRSLTHTDHPETVIID
ncbi:modification methylase HphIA [Arthroderma uncinatum]|uniref:modification methylase HphIA n=1 Tax=Arthroderma uncinatum TaxID=74035 RepID=UPI00144A79D9|nr:modification methylase HphIA [Arthroderma uncinatum]KAF3490671.1 modification methylase HphIA [Arthroderma uncinatum]